MGTGNFSDDFKRDAVAQITERGYPIKEVSERLGVSLHSLYAWKRKFAKATLRVSHDGGQRFQRMMGGDFTRSRAAISRDRGQVWSAH